MDMRAEMPHGVVNIQVKYRSRGPLGLRDLRDASAKLRASGFDGGFLLVTNAPLSEEVRQQNASQSEAEVITWNDVRDDDLLLRALTRNGR